MDGYRLFYGVGQALGLGLAAAIQILPLWGMGLAALLMVPGYFLGRMGLPADKDRQKANDISLNHHALRHPRLGYLQLHPAHAISFKGVKSFMREWKGPFGVFLAGWFLCVLGSWMVYNLYPLLMQQLYGVDAAASSGTYAIAATLGIFLYAPSGMLGEKIGDGPVLTIGFIMTLITMLGMTYFAYVSSAYTWWLSQAFFILMPMAWSPLIVAGTAYTAQLATMPEGSALGIFNSVTAVGSVIGALAAGWLADAFGYGVVMVSGTSLTIISLVVLMSLLRNQRIRRKQFKSHREVMKKPS